MSVSLIAGLPNSPLVDANGQIMPEWRAFLQNLWARTGGTIGISSDTTTLKGELAAETAARVNGDAALQASLNTEAGARTGGDAANAAAVANEAAIRGRADALEASSRAQGDTPAAWAARNYSVCRHPIRAAARSGSVVATCMWEPKDARRSH
jgi:hypothetical protein